MIGDSMKLLATDFDMTLFGNNDYKKNIKMINKFVDKGNIFVIATGRHIDTLLKDIKNMNLKYSYLICNDGGIIFDKDLNILCRIDIDNKISKEIAQMYENSNCLENWYIDTGTTMTQDKTSIANGLIGKIKSKYDTEVLLKDIKNKYNEIDGYVSRTWINITKKGVSKGSAIKHLSDLLRIDTKDVYAIGDNINDISLTEYGFNSYSMMNSVTELKKVTNKSYDHVFKLVEDIIKDMH
jgi:HAD superfamily hydrolase (TIGR01484 family)